MLAVAPSIPARRPSPLVQPWELLGMLQKQASRRRPFVAHEEENPGNRLHQWGDSKPSPAKTRSLQAAGAELTF
jgi:hypothetical protein